MPDDTKPISPSEFLRARRPEIYSDSEERVGYELDRAVFEYHLDTLTQRNQTHDFEIFARKLSERVIAKNLRPQTGPEGGGDSKADTETLPAAEEIAERWYEGDVNAGAERWAFAFSAKKTWKQKIKTDVDGIVATGRGYRRVICMTSRAARAKDRAALEDELTAKHKVPVTIYDRNWIVDTVLTNGLEDLAFNYLGVGREIEKQRLGPNDYSRAQQLEDIEKAIADPAHFAGMEPQLVTEALVAAKLSRNMERPRLETDGRFARAVRLAEKYGLYRQKLEAHYEAIWTAFWYFDELDAAAKRYDAFEAMAIGSGDARDIELIASLFQLLVNNVIRSKVDPKDLALGERTERLCARFDAIAADMTRPNNALEAEASKLTIELNLAAVAGDDHAIAAFWPRFADVLDRAKAFGEFNAERFLKMIDAFGALAGKDAGFTALVEKTAAFVTERKGEAEGAKVLLKRASQLGFDERLDMIRLLGRAAHLLTKKEYAEELIDAMQRLSVAYRSAGLLWAARASFAFALAAIAIEAHEEGSPRPQIIPTLKFYAWVALQLRHLPDFIKAMQLLNGIRRGMVLSDEQRAHLERSFTELDMAMASQLVNLNDAELQRVADLPDILGAVDLLHSRTALLYALGYEDALRADGWIPESETPDGMREHFTRLASQPVSDRIWGPLILNEAGAQRFATAVLGVEISVNFTGTATATTVAEAILGTLEAYLATAIEMGVHPHTERFEINIIQRADLDTPEVKLRAEALEADVFWPAAVVPGHYEHQHKIQEALLEIAGVTLAAISLMDNFEEIIARLHADDAVMQRMALIAVASNSHSRMFGEAVARIQDWSEAIQTRYPVRDDRPKIIRAKPPPRPDRANVADVASDDDDDQDNGRRNHRDATVRSVLNVHAWNRAEWAGAGYYYAEPGGLPGLALLFHDRDGAVTIFEQWRERFGGADADDDIYIAIITGVDPARPSHYQFMITARPREHDMKSGKLISMTHKAMTMTSASTEHVLGFIEEARAAGGYELFPIILHHGAKEPEMLRELALKKVRIHTKARADIEQNDLEIMAFPELAAKAPAKS